MDYRSPLARVRGLVPQKRALLIGGCNALPQWR